MRFVTVLRKIIQASAENEDDFLNNLLETPVISFLMLLVGVAWSIDRRRLVLWSENMRLKEDSVSYSLCDLAHHCRVIIVFLLTSIFYR